MSEIQPNMGQNELPLYVKAIERISVIGMYAVGAGAGIESAIDDHNLLLVPKGVAVGVIAAGLMYGACKLVENWDSNIK